MISSGTCLHICENGTLTTYAHTRPHSYAKPLIDDAARAQYIPTYDELYRASFGSGERARKEAWNLKLLAVHPDARRRGLGKLLLSTFCKQVSPRATS